MSQWIFQISCGSNAGMTKTALLVTCIVSNALFYSNSHINQMTPRIIHILLLSGRLAASDLVAQVHTDWDSLSEEPGFNFQVGR